MKGDGADERDLYVCRCICAKVQHKRFCTIKDMPVCSGDHGWIIDPGKKEKMASYGRRFCFHFQLYIDYGEICEDLYGRTLKRFLINANCGTVSW